MPAVVFSFDFDGCLFHKYYINSQEKDVIKCNQLFLDTLKKAHDSYTHKTTFIGSNRQSHSVDQFNDLKNKTGSCFTAIEAVASYLGVALDPFLLADVHANLEDGTSFRRARDESYRDQHAHWCFDTTKASLLYAQMHRVASRYHDDSIDFHFYDDRFDILDKLKTFFSQHCVLIPQNVTLRLYQYKGKPCSKRAKIRGKGFIDENYKETTREMWKIAGGDAMTAVGGHVGEINTADYVKPELLMSRVPLASVADSVQQADSSLFMFKFFRLFKKSSVESDSQVGDIAHSDRGVITTTVEEDLFEEYRQ